MDEERPSRLSPTTRGMDEERPSRLSPTTRSLRTRAARLVAKRHTSASLGRRERGVSNVMPLRALLGQRALSAIDWEEAPMIVSTVLDSAGGRRSPATLPGYRAGRTPQTRDCVTPPTRRPWRRSLRSCAKPATIVTAQAPRADHRALAPRAAHPGSARARRARPRPRRGSLLVRNGKGGRRREIGMDAWGWEQLRPWLDARAELPTGRCSASSTARPAGGRGRAPMRASSFAGSRPKRVSGAGSRRTSCATPTPSNSPARACRST
jgi:hypothetical protein